MLSCSKINGASLWWCSHLVVGHGMFQKPCDQHVNSPSVCFLSRVGGVHGLQHVPAGEAHLQQRNGETRQRRNGSHFAQSLWEGGWGGVRPRVSKCLLGGFCSWELCFVSSARLNSCWQNITWWSKATNSLRTASHEVFWSSITEVGSTWHLCLPNWHYTQNDTVLS